MDCCCKVKRQRRCLLIYECIAWLSFLAMSGMAVANTQSLSGVSYIQTTGFVLWLICSIGIAAALISTSFKRDYRVMMAYACLSLPRPILFLIVLFYEFEDKSHRNRAVRMGYNSTLIMALLAGLHFVLTISSIVTALQIDPERIGNPEEGTSGTYLLPIASSDPDDSTAAEALRSLISGDTVAKTVELSKEKRVKATGETLVVPKLTLTSFQ